MRWLRDWSAPLTVAMIGGVLTLAAALIFGVTL